MTKFRECQTCVCMFSVSITKSLGTQNEKEKKKIYLVHSLRGLREKLKYRLSSGEGSKVLGFQVVATIRE